MSMTLSSEVEQPVGDRPAPSDAVVALVAYARGVPSAAREAFAAQLAEFEADGAMIVIHTCQRVELYVAVDAFGERSLPAVPPGAVRMDGAAAARHLISVACGLESPVLGEDQVLHQIRQAYVARRAAAPLDQTLDHLFRVSMQAGRRARDMFGGERRSLADVALDEIELRAGPVENRPILVVGAGSMGRLAALAAARRGAEVIVTNRTEARAASLAGTVGGKTLPWGADGELPAFAGAVVAVGGRWEVSADDARAIVESGAAVIDLSSPPATPDGLAAGLGDRFVSVDDLAWGPQTKLRDGLRDRLETLVSETGRDYCRWLRARDSQPAIKAMTEAVERRRQSELEWLIRRLPGLSEEETALIDQMSHRLVGGILHAPRSALNLDDTGELGRAARELFGL